MIINFLNDKERKQIGFNYILDKLIILTPFGYEEKKNLRPFLKHEKLLLIKEYNNIKTIITKMESNKKIFHDIERILFKFKDIRNSIIRCKNLAILDEVELYEIKVFSMLIEDLRILLNRLKLDIDEIDLFSLEKVVELLDPENKRMPTFHIYEAYSFNLKQIREKKRHIEKEIFAVTDPETLEKLKLERLDIVIMEEEEELKIKKEISEKLSFEAEKIEKNIKMIGRLDFLIAKAKLAVEYNCSKPIISEVNEIKIKNMFNPEVFEILKLHNKKFTPVSLEIKSGTTIITGANMGGKTVALKTLVLNLLTGTMGFFVFAEKAEFPIFDFIYFVSDDLQSVLKGLSSFGAEIIKLKEILLDVKTNTGLIVLDEFAKGTNPKEGFFLVKAVSGYLNRFSSVTVISTHYDGIVSDEMIHYQVIGLKHANFEEIKRKINLKKSNSIEIIQEYMDYNLEKITSNHEVPKDALNISMLLGLDEDIINLAKSYYEEEEK
ncbi:MAG: MutS-related protein [Thermoanaerobacteraceae bacterium]